MEGLRSQQDSQALECQICLNEYSWRRRAKLLACRHTCCSACLGRMVTVRSGESDRDGGETASGPSGSAERRHVSRRHALVVGVEDGQRGHGPRHHHHHHQRPVVPGSDERRDEPEGAAFRPGADTEQQRGSQRQTADGGAVSGQQRDDQLTPPGHGEIHGEPERDQREVVIMIRYGSAKTEQNHPQRPTAVGGAESGQRQNRAVAQLTHSDPGTDQREESDPQRQMGNNDMEAGLRDVMVLRHHEMDSGHHHHHHRHHHHHHGQGDSIHQREALVGQNPMEIHDSGTGGTARGQTEIPGGPRNTIATNGGETSADRNDSTAVGFELRPTDQGETMASRPRDVGAARNERRTDGSGREDSRSTYRTVIVCPWCRGVTALPDGLSVNHLPDDEDKMAAVTPTAPPPPLTQECMPVFIRLLPSANSYLIPWSVDGDGAQETGGAVQPSSAHYLLPVYMERDDGARDSVVISNARHFLLSAGGAAYLDGGGTAEDAGGPGVAQSRWHFPRPTATGQRRPPPRAGDPSGTRAGVRGEGERAGLREEEVGSSERRRDPEEEKRSGKLWTRVCTVIVLGLVVFLLLCIVLHTVACPSRSFTMISCG